MITVAMEKRKMDKYINAKSLYNQIAEKEELARQRVIDTPSKLPNGDVNPYAIRYAAQLDERTAFKFMLADAPTADVVEVVRCKNCKHSEHWYGDKQRCFLWHEDGIDVFETGYCSYGERKDG